MNEQNLQPIRSKKEAREKGRNGGIQSGKVRKERKTVAQALMDALLRKCPTGNTYYDEIMKKCSDNMLSNPVFKDIEVLQKIMGEQAAEKHEVGFVQIKVESNEDAKTAGEVGSTFQ